MVRYSEEWASAFSWPSSIFSQNPNRIKDPPSLSLFCFSETMRDENCKKSKISWSKSFVRKWLNIKTKAQDFHADVAVGRGDGEWRTSFSEREVCTVKKSKTEKSTKRNSDRAWRGKFDPDSAQTTEVQDYRIFAGTWNVGGKSPPSFLNLDDWLHAPPPADIYVLGFQEIVPLNAGNVLGTEDDAPARKWVSLIRRTLNNLRGACFNSSYHTRSPVPEPVVELDDDIEGSSARQRNSYFFHRRSFQSVSRSMRIDGDMTPQAKLDRRYSVCDRVIFGSRPSDFDSNSRSGGDSSDDENIGEDLPRPVFISPTSYGYGAPLTMEDRERPSGNSRWLGYFSQWVRSETRDYVKNIKVSCVGRGLMGYLGNKGSISVSMSLHQTSFCFICSHLTSGQKEGDELRRNSDVMEILRKTRFPHRQGDDKSPETVLKHDRIIWLGDLNYRIALSYRSAKNLVEMHNWQALLHSDQLRVEQRYGRVFESWNEGRIYFPPTYKYSNNSDRYAGDNMNPKEKRRTPAWCDRILWHGRGLTQLSYVRGESRFSDHRPVYSIFAAEVESINHGRLRRNMGYSSSRVEVEELLPYAYGYPHGYTELGFY